MANLYRLLVIIAACISAGFGSLIAQSLSVPMAASVDSIFAPYNRPDVPGCALAIYRDDRIIYAKGYGSADLERSVPITPHTVFYIGSTSKQFTAACMVLLQQQGKLSLEDDIRNYLPEFPDYGHPITIRNLLNHTSGIREYNGLLGMAGFSDEDVVTADDGLNVLLRQRDLNFEPGTKMRYSNSNYFLAAVIIKRVSGKSLREFAREQIFQPLGMAHTTFIDDHTELIPNRALGYDPKEDGHYVLAINNWEDVGAGGIYTTVEDLLQWDRNFYTPRVGGAALNAAMLRRGILKNGDTITYSLGLFQEKFRGLETVVHDGARGGYRAQLMRIPSAHLSVAVLANASQIDAGELAQRVVEVVLADRLAKPDAAHEEESATKVVAIDSALFDRYAGEYELEEQAGFIFGFMREGMRMFVAPAGEERSELFPSSDSTFFIKEAPVSFTFHHDSAGGVMSLTMHQDGDHLADRVLFAAPSAAELERYAGTYYSPELGATYILSVEKGALTARQPRLAPVTLTPPRSAAPFTGNQWYMTQVIFDKGADGTVKGMYVSGGRIRKIRFDRQK